MRVAFCLIYVNMFCYCPWSYELDLRKRPFLCIRMTKQTTVTSWSENPLNIFFPFFWHKIRWWTLYSYQVSMEVVCVRSICLQCLKECIFIRWMKIRKSIVSLKPFSRFGRSTRYKSSFYKQLVTTTSYTPRRTWAYWTSHHNGSNVRLRSFCL